MLISLFHFTPVRLTLCSIIQERLWTFMAMVPEMKTCFARCNESRHSFDASSTLAKHSRDSPWYFSADVQFAGPLGGKWEYVAKPCKTHLDRILSRWSLHLPSMKGPECTPPYFVLCYGIRGVQRCRFILQSVFLPTYFCGSSRALPFYSKI